MNATKQRPKSPTVVDNVSDMQVNTWYINPTKGTSFLGREDEAYVALGLFIPSNCEWLVTLVKGGKKGKNAHILTVNTAVFPSLWHNFTLLLPSLFGIKHPAIIQGISFMLAVIIHEKSTASASENQYFLDFPWYFGWLECQRSARKW